MKILSAFRLTAVLAVLALAPACQDFLDKEPLGTPTDANLFKDPKNAVQAVNSIYDAASWDEGPKWGSGPYVGHMYEWMFGDVMSDDAEKGSTPSDFTPISDLKTWIADPSNAIIGTLWTHCFTGIARANIVINNVDGGTIDDNLKQRLKGEALFLRGYFYFYLVREFGGVPLFEKSVLPAEAASVQRASIAETFAFIEKDLRAAAALLPEKSGYPAADLGRATKGAANAYLARVIMYQLGTVNGANHTWQNVYDQTNTVIASNQYGLTGNYATVQEFEGRNNTESIFELQFVTSNESYGPVKSGTTSNVFQNNRSTWGYGFNNPTQNLVSEFEANDPRLPVTVIRNNDIVLGIRNPIDLATNATGFLNRKAAILQPAQTKAGDQNIRKIRYADMLLMKAEAAANLGLASEAVGLVNQIRQRARNATKPKGSIVGSLTYEPANLPAGTLPDLATNLSGPTLMAAIWHERRVELGMEALRYWDLVRTGRYLPSLPVDARARCLTRCFTQGTVNPLPLLPIPLVESQTYKLPQNPGY